MNSLPTPPPKSSRWLPSQTFSGRTALVTGGGTGLGLEIARGLAELGASVHIASRNAEHHQALRNEAAARGWQVAAHTLDVRDNHAIERLAAELPALDMLINNAAGNFVCPAERLSANAWRAVLGIVLDGTFYCSKSFGRRMIEAGGGQILNIVATYAWTGMPGVVHSASAKAGVLAMTRTLAAEWARHSIRVNAVAPGPFHSEGAANNLWPEDLARQHLEQRVPLKRFATADEVAAQCLHLLSPASAYITGECLVIDGGASLGQGMWEPGARFTRQRNVGESGGGEA